MLCRCFSNHGLKLRTSQTSSYIPFFSNSYGYTDAIIRTFRMCNYHSINLNMPIHNITAKRAVMQTRIIRVAKSWKLQFNKNFKNKNNNILTSEAVLRPKVH